MSKRSEIASEIKIPLSCPLTEEEGIGSAPCPLVHKPPGGGNSYPHPTAVLLASYCGPTRILLRPYQRPTAVLL